MPQACVTAEGRPVALGRLLGRGGEGAVFTLRDEPARVAKLYHRPPDARKQAKLRHMAARADAALLACAAWPQQTLHHAGDGAVIGFLMPRVADRDAIHAIYSPQDRWQLRPRAGWDYLLAVARNTAAAFAALHARGHVLGDVNQGNVVVAGNGAVALIDCDSFQVQAGGALHTCEVGVGHFTPPELQGLASFRGVVRSANHDNFGLAVLLFHLLLGGRHPYAGVPLAPAAGDALEADIGAFRYAYARDAARRGMAPPPCAIPLALLPAPLQAMFERAFTEPGAQDTRPTAAEWVAALDALRAGLQRCPAAALHVYPRHLMRCPWCALQQRGVLQFLDGGATGRSGFSLAAAWRAIEAVPPPPPVALLPASAAAPVPRPFAGAAHCERRRLQYRGIALLVVAAILLAAPGAWLFALIDGLLAWWIAASFADAPRHRERDRRRAALHAAERELAQRLEAARHAAGPEGFGAHQARLARLRRRHLQLQQQQARALARLAGSAHAAAAARIRARFAAHSAPLEAGLARGAADLQRFGQQAARQLAQLAPGLQQAARAVEQAQVDLQEVMRP